MPRIPRRPLSVEAGKENGRSCVFVGEERSCIRMYVCTTSPFEHSMCCYSSLCAKQKNV